MIRKLLRRLKKSDRGASIIELALILPLLLALVIGIIEFGWIYNGHIVITGAAREGARLAARGESVAIIDNRVQNHATTFRGETVSATVLTPNYPDGIAPGEEITVRVSGDLPLLVKFVGSIIPFPIINDGESITLSAEATMRREYYKPK